MSRNLSQIAADLLGRPMTSRELSDQIQRLGLEIRLVVQSEDTLFGRFRRLLESLRTIIPDEKQRYQAALQALSNATKLNRQELLKAMNGQLEELKLLERGLLSAQSGWRYGQNGMEARSQQLKGELAQLRGRLTQLESEERAVLTRMSEREKDLALAEKTGKGLFADIAAEIGACRKKLEESTTEAAAAQPIPLAVQPVRPAAKPAQPAARTSPKKEPQKSTAPSKRKDSEQKAGIKASSSQQDAKVQRTCPMCGGRFHLLALEKKRQCFTCAYEEPAADAPSPETPEQAAAPAPSSLEPASLINGPAESKKSSARSGSQPGARKRSCPVCFKKMVWSPGEKVWRCPSGHHETR